MVKTPLTINRPSGTIASLYDVSARREGNWIMNAVYAVSLAIAAFWLGACPFSLWIGKLLLNKDIRDYGDGNPGATNVFRAGGFKAGILAVFLDIAKGMPFVALASYFFGLQEIPAMMIGLCAILGNAFSPLLRFKGAKALAVTGGVLLALPQHEMVILVLSLTFLGFLLIRGDSWCVMFGLIITLIYLIIARGFSPEPLFVLCVILILTIKHFSDLKKMPALGGFVGSRISSWMAHG